MQARELNDLIDREDPAWPHVLAWIAEARRTVEVLPTERQRGERALLRLQVTTRSVLGALALESGGVLFDHGWLRVLGCGTDRLRGSLLSWNGLDGDGVEPSVAGSMLVAHDAVGGFFAINGDPSSERRGIVFYFAPDSLEWEDLGMSHSELVHWAATGDLNGFYASVRWPGWEEDVGRLSADDGFSIYPYLWSQGPPVADRSRRPVPMTELWRLHNDLARQLRGDLC